MNMPQELMDQMVAYHQERLEASMRAAESDRVVIMMYRARLGAFLIAIGERVRGDSVLDRMAPMPPQRRQVGHA